MDAYPHRRFNPLLGTWVLVSPHRTQRPWQGEVGRPDLPSAVHYDPACYLCPGNERAGGHRNPKYQHVFAFDNDYAALLPEAPEPPSEPPLLIAERERGKCRVLCFDPDHSLTLARMEQSAVVRVVEAWQQESASLSSEPHVRHVQIFENRGAMMGASNPHPHCQIWATEHIPDEPQAEIDCQLAYTRAHGSCLLCDYLKLEEQKGERLVCANDEFVAVVPFWAVWPFETLVMARRHGASMDAFDSAQREGLADLLRRLTVRYDNLFSTSFPYTMGFHQGPADEKSNVKNNRALHFHGHFLPPLLRSATVRKFMVGFELLGMPQRDITAESAAERLRELSEVHFSASPAGQL